MNKCPSPRPQCHTQWDCFPLYYTPLLEFTRIHSVWPEELDSSFLRFNLIPCHLKKLCVCVAYVCGCAYTLKCVSFREVRHHEPIITFTPNMVAGRRCKSFTLSAFASRIQRDYLMASNLLRSRLAIIGIESVWRFNFFFVYSHSLVFKITYNKNATFRILELIIKDLVMNKKYKINNTIYRKQIIYFLLLLTIT